MSYYLTAHRNNRKINIPIEEKHKYITDKLRVSGSDILGLSYNLPETSIRWQPNSIVLNKPSYSSVISNDWSNIPEKVDSIPNNPSASGLNLISNYVKLFYRPSMLTIEQGTGPRERIGDKVYLKSVQIMLNLTAMKGFYRGLLGNAQKIGNTLSVPYPTNYTTTGAGGQILTSTVTTDLYTYQNNRMNTKQFAKFRVMIVRFDDLSDTQSKEETALKIFIRDWFNTIFVPLAIVPHNPIEDLDGYSGVKHLDIPVVSNQSKMLRESTQYTGSFKILYDEMIELNQHDFSKHIKINLEPKTNLTFKDSDNNPTTEYFNNVFGFIIPPTYYKTDMDIETYDELLNLPSSSTNIAEFTTNIKFTYYDI